MSTSFQPLRLKPANRPPVGDAKRERFRVLFVHDENTSLEIFATSLRSAGYDLFPVWTGREALQTFHLVRPDLILLELNLSDMDGKQVLRHLRESTSIPIVVISFLQEETEQIACLDAGADDYVTKPFSTDKLLARLRAVLRRAFGIPRSEVLKTGGLRVDFSMRAVFVFDEQVQLTATEYALLTVLARHAGMVKSHYQLIHEVWGTMQYQDAVHLLRVTMSNLRRKLACDSRSLIVTEVGIGYKLRRDSEWSLESVPETSLRKTPIPMSLPRMRSGTCSRF
jgi:two-component system KDP operon response regulator KdpE